MQWSHDIDPNTLTLINPCPGHCPHHRVLQDPVIQSLVGALGFDTEARLLGWSWWLPETRVYTYMEYIYIYMENA